MALTLNIKNVVVERLAGEVARLAGELLLCVGQDFARTDLDIA